MTFFPVIKKLEQRAARKAKREEKAKRLKTRKPSLTSLKKKLWSLLSVQIRLNYGPICYTCGGNGNQAGHMFPKGRAHALSAWHPGNLRPQCFYCNINLGGNGAEFASRYQAREGAQAFSRMATLSRTPHKWTPDEIETLISKIQVSLAEYSEYYDERYGH